MGNILRMKKVNMHKTWTSPCISLWVCFLFALYLSWLLRLRVLCSMDYLAVSSTTKFHCNSTINNKLVVVLIWGTACIAPVSAN